MNFIHQNKKTVALTFLVILGILVCAYWFFWSRKDSNPIADIFGRAVVVEETVKVPDIDTLTHALTRSVVRGSYEVPLVPSGKNEEIFIPGSPLSLTSAYELAKQEVLAWSSDARLVAIHSLATVNLQGECAGWRIVFDSPVKKKGYEIVIKDSTISLEREVASGVSGAETPKNWYPLSDGIISLQTLPQFKEAKLLGVVFFYNPDDKQWRYGFETSLGTTSLIVR